jgi:quinol monooxygenase YgiN
VVTIVHGDLYLSVAVGAIIAHTLRKYGDLRMEQDAKDLVAIERLSIVLAPERAEPLRRALSTLVGPTSSERGCLSCELYVAWPTPNTVLLECRWDTLENLVQHLRSKTYKDILQLMELGAEAPVVEFLTISERKGLEFVAEVRGLPQ